MSFYIKVSPLLEALIKEIEESNSDDLSYELWRDVCINDGWVEVNVQQDDWVNSIKDDTKRELVMAYNSLNQDLKWNTKKKEKRLFRKGEEVISFEKDLEGYWEYLSQNK